MMIPFMVRTVIPLLGAYLLLSVGNYFHVGLELFLLVLLMPWIILQAFAPTGTTFDLACLLVGSLPKDPQRRQLAISSTSILTFLTLTCGFLAMSTSFAITTTQLDNPATIALKLKIGSLFPLVGILLAAFYKVLSIIPGAPLSMNNFFALSETLAFTLLAIALSISLASF